MSRAAWKRTAMNEIKIPRRQSRSRPVSTSIPIRGISRNSVGFPSNRSENVLAPGKDGEST